MPKETCERKTVFSTFVSKVVCRRCRDICTERREREREVRTKFLAGWAQSEVQEMRTSCLLSQHVHVCVLCVCVPSETPQGVTEAAAAAAASVTVAQLQHICVLCCPEDNECTWPAPAQFSLPFPLSPRLFYSTLFLVGSTINFCFQLPHNFTFCLVSNALLLCRNEVLDETEE